MRTSLLSLFVVSSLNRRGQFSADIVRAHDRGEALRFVARWGHSGAAVVASFPDTSHGCLAAERATLALG